MKDSSSSESLEASCAPLTMEVPLFLSYLVWAPSSMPKNLRTSAGVGKRVEGGGGPEEAGVSAGEGCGRLRGREPPDCCRAALGRQNSGDLARLWHKAVVCQLHSEAGTQ